MGNVDLNFKSAVPTFDANVALGRRHDRRVVVDTTEGLLEAMDGSGVERAVVYSPYAAHFDTVEGNEQLLEMIEGQPRLIPQLVANPAVEDLATFAAQVASLGVRSIRFHPAEHKYPFRDWVVGPWLEWLESEGIPLWIPVPETDPVTLQEVAAGHPGLSIVLTECHYSQVPWAIPFLRSVSNTSLEVSRWVIADGVKRLMDTVGPQRILFGSRFPDSSMGNQLYNLHRSDLSDNDLAAICAGNLDRLLGLE